MDGEYFPALSTPPEADWSVAGSDDRATPIHGESPVGHFNHAPSVVWSIGKVVADGGAIILTHDLHVFTQSGIIDERALALTEAGENGTDIAGVSWGIGFPQLLRFVGKESPAN